MLLIGLSGKMGSGKNYISSKYILPILKSKGHDVLEMSLADQIKINVMTNNNLKYEELYVNKSTETRTLLQYEGTERGRRQLGEDVWIRYLDNWISIYSKRGITAFVITDVRFKNEIDWIKKRDGILIKVVAPKRNEERLRRESNNDEHVYKRIKLHQSETEIDTIEENMFDLVILNDDSHGESGERLCESGERLCESGERKHSEQYIQSVEPSEFVIKEQILDLINNISNRKKSKIIVQKFGGTSVGTPEKMTRVANIIKNYIESGDKLYVVVSAISPNTKSSGTTNQLLQCTKSRDFEETVNKIRDYHVEFAKYINNLELENYIIDTCKNILSLLHAAFLIGELTNRSRDMIISKGEEMSARILKEYIGINAKISEINELNKDKDNDTLVWVFSGYTENVIEIAGRGYSDYTAAQISSIIDADELQIWKEVDGIFTADPNIVLNAKLLKTITKGEISQLTYYGCQAVNPLAIQQVRCPIIIKNCNNPTGDGTIITDDEVDNSVFGPIAVTTKQNIHVINISSNNTVSPDFFAKVFGVLREHNIIIDVVSTSQVDISIAIDSTQNYHEPTLIKELSKYGKVDITRDLCVLSLIGKKMIKSIGIAAKMFRILSKNKINIQMISQGASEINISCVISQADALKALCYIHYDLIE